METDGEQNQQGASTNGSAASGTSSHPSMMSSMSLYERQAVQALQALQSQPNAAQYFHQLMLQQQINNVQLQNLAAVRQATLAASRQSSPSSSSSSQTTSTTAAGVTSGAGSTTSSRPMGASATSTISQSVVLSGAAGAQGQMYLRVNRSLRAPISSQLIFMPGNTTTAGVATVTQQPQAQQQQQEVVPTSSASSQSDNDQVQNLARRGVSSPKVVGVKTEAPERSDSAAYSLVQNTHQSNAQSPIKPSQPHPQPPHIKIPTYPQPTNLKAQPSSSSGTSSSSSTSSIPLSQLLLHGTRTLTTGTTAPSAAHTLVLTSNAASQPHGYPVGTATIKPAVNTQTLVVQPLQKTALGGEKTGHGNGPIPIQPKTLQGLRLPLQLPSRNPPPILPAPPPASSSSQALQPPHIPVQIVGARQSTLGNAQALALARNSCSQDAVLSSNPLQRMMARMCEAVDRGVLLSPQEASINPYQLIPEHPQANQSTAQSQNGAPASSPASSQSPTLTAPPPSLSRSSLPLPLTTEEQRGASAVVTTNGDSSGSQTPQVKPATGSLKRKSDTNLVNDDDGPSPPRIQPVTDHTSTMPVNPTETGSGPAPPPPPPPPAPAPASSSPSPVLTVSRGVCGQEERAPPPQAVVKPHVLTHLIEGFVIQEGAEPFPVCGPVKDPAAEDLTNDSPDTNQLETVTPATVLKCEYCKNFAPASQFRGTKRFCSMSCAKRYNVSFRQHFCVRQTQGQGRDHTPDQDRSQGHLSNSDEDGGIVRRRVPRRTSSEIASAKIAGRPIPVKCHSESSHSEEESSVEEDEDDPMSLSPASSASCHQPPPPLPTESSAPSCLSAIPSQWSVEDVSQFISSLQGCEEVASQFLSQEIDGQALLLLKEEHLMSTMNIKLGPALKICAHINTLRD